MTSTDSTRKLALAGGVLYLVTFASSIPTLALKAPFVDHADFILGRGADTGVIWAALLDVICGLAGIGTAVALYPIVRRHSRSSAVGFVGSRTLEAAVLFVGAISVMSAVSLRSSGGDTAALLTTGKALVAMHRWSFLLGPGLMPALNAAFLATALYRARLVPRLIPLMGLVGAPLLVASSVATMFGGPAQTSSSAALCALPIAAWEFSVGVYLIVRGTRGTAEGDRAPVAGLAFAAS